MKLGALFSKKLKLGVEGRQKSIEKIKEKFNKNDRIIWMHAASLGEYEQGLAVLEQLKNCFPHHKILVTFFSPSGYENAVKKNKIADVMCYLPIDFKRSVQEFTSCFKTDVFFTVKYDFWYHLLVELKRQNAKVYVISAFFYPQQIFFKPFGKWFVKNLKTNIDWFFHQNETSLQLAKSIGLENGSVSGDTRFDRVRQIKNRNNFVEFIEEFKENKTTLVFGSSWEAEEKIAQQISEKNRDVKIILAPHDLKRVENLKKIFPEALLYSQIESTTINQLQPTILIIDCIGLLSKIYSYADLAVVGGGFHSAGLHNILEAATFGIPVFFGNQYRKNPEADALIARNGGKSFQSENEASNFILNLLEDENLRTTMGKNAEEFIFSQPNSTEIILKKILSDFPIS